METILVSGASGVVGYGILKSLRKYNRIGTTIYDFSVASNFCESVEKIRPTDNKDYIGDLCDIIRDYNIDMIIPSIECDMYKWNQYRETLEILTFPLLNNRKLIELCEDKWNFYQKLIENNIEYSIPTSLKNRMYAFPVLLKPRKGFGSKGIVRVNNEAEFELYQNQIGSKLMIQPIIGKEDEEFTVSGFFDVDSNLLDYFPLRRKLSNGFTGEAIVEDRDFGAVLTDLAKTFKPIGATNFQFRFDGDTPNLLEINPRISSATSIRAAFGYNEAEMSVDYFLHGKIPKPFKKPIGRRAIRYTEDYIL